MIAAASGGEKAPPEPRPWPYKKTMSDLSDILSHRLLPQVRQPSQYVGLEINARHGDFQAAAVRVALCFPDAYALGICHLGSQVLYNVVNDLPYAMADRSYCPLSDAQAIMRREGIGLFGWESRRSLSDFDIVGFSLPHEGCLTNVLAMLDLAGISLHAQDRRQEEPIVIAGDAQADQPEPMADFIDLFCVGDGEEPLARLVELVRQAKAARTPRQEIILQAARTIPGLYAPGFYRPRYDEAGSFAGMDVLVEGLPPRVRRAHLANLADSPAMTAPLVPLAEAVHDRVTIEIMRGCPNACRFCQAGAVRRPVRWRSVEDILATAEKALAATGYREVSLLSLSTSDYPHFNELIERMVAEFTPRNISVSLPSLRVDSQLEVIPRLTSQVRKGGLTLAAEAGTQRLRELLRKGITEEKMLEGVRAAWRAGFRSIKVYFMAGLPGETEADVDEIFHLCRRLADTRKEIDGQRGSINASVSWFVPRPHTPLQWAPMCDEAYFWSVRNRLRDLSRRSTVSFKFHRIERSLLEGAIARGDRRMGAVIETAWRLGAGFDGWDEHWSWEKWQEAFSRCGIDPAACAQRQRRLDEPLPWDHIDSGRGNDFLRREYQQAVGQQP
jgi:radical SAM family uncharacterized protein